MGSKIKEVDFAAELDVLERIANEGVSGDQDLPRVTRFNYYKTRISLAFDHTKVKVYEGVVKVGKAVAGVPRSVYRYLKSIYDKIETWFFSHYIPYQTKRFNKHLENPYRVTTAEGEEILCFTRREYLKEAFQQAFNKIKSVSKRSKSTDIVPALNGAVIEMDDHRPGMVRRFFNKIYFYLTYPIFALMLRYQESDWELNIPDWVKIGLGVAVFAAVYYAIYVGVITMLAGVVMTLSEFFMGMLVTVVWSLILIGMITTLSAFFEYVLG